MKDFRNFKFSSNITSNAPECQGVSLSSLTSSQTRVFDKILILGNKHEYVFPNQTTLGKAANIGRRQTNRIIKQLCEWGLLEKLTRPNLTCVYRVPKFLLDPKIRQRYSQQFEAFRWLPLMLLFCPLFNLGVTRTISVNKLFKTDLITDTSNINKLTDSKRRVGVYGSEARSKLILEIGRDLRLSRLGQVKLAPYPFECLQYTQEQFRRVKNPRDSFKVFVSLCNEWCRINDVRPDWKVCYDLYENLKLDPSASFYDESLPVKQQQHYQNSPSGFTKGFPKQERSSRSTPQRPIKEYQREAIKPFNMREYLAKQKVKAQKIRDEGNEEWAQKLECEITKEVPVQYHAALMVARSAPDFVKEDWTLILKTDPDIISEPVRQAIREYQEKKEVPLERNTFTDLADAMVKKRAETDLELMDDESVWEEVDIAVHLRGDIISSVSKSPF